MSRRNGAAMIRELARPAGATDSRPPLRIHRQPLLPCLLVWKSGAINSLLPGQEPAPAPTLDAGPVISKSADAMQGLKSVHLSLSGNLVLNGLAGVKITGSGDLIYPHKENLSLQMEVPSSDGYVIV